MAVVDSVKPKRIAHAVVVVPCFNHGRFVADAVRSALRQADAHVRVVVVNDGSTDSTTAAACDCCHDLDERKASCGPRVRVVHQDNLGLSAARNAGVLAATEMGWLGGPTGEECAEYLVFLDADDFIDPTFVSTLARRIAEESDGPESEGRAPVSHAYCQERLVDKAFGIWNVPDWDPELLLITNLHPITVLLRAEWFERVGGFDESMRDGYEDWEFWIRIAAMGGRGVRVREPLFNWRRHSDVTMVIEAVARHEQLVGQIMHKHETLYTDHAMSLLRRSNVLLRKGDANWLDEHHDAIVPRDLRAANAELWRDFCLVREERDRLSAELAAARGVVDGVRGEYERKPVVKVSRRLHQWLDAMGPVGRVMKGAAKAAARVLS